MIARIFIPLLLLIIIPDLYVHLHYLRHRVKSKWKQLIWWIPSVLMLAFTIYLAWGKGFAPGGVMLVNSYLFLLGVLVIPKAVFSICSFLGWRHCKFHKTKKNWGNIVGILLAAGIIYIVVYGSTIGFNKIEVRHEDYYSSQLPKSFDGYRIVHLSDIHIGTYTNGNSWLLKAAIDSVNVQHPDLIAFTGDLQNREPSELYPHIETLSALKATDGVFSVRGNHDYADYIHAEPAVKVANERELVSRQRQMGWNVLVNEHISVRHGKDSIVIAGMENDGTGPFPKRGDVKKTMSGVSDNAFVLMLEHDPTSWKRNILPKSNAQLTLSGHTHAMQFSLFGWSPASLIYDEWGGLFYEGDRAINVSTGLGGFIPFRFGVTGEIVVVTLHSK